jgi:hypothetical protein
MSGHGNIAIPIVVTQLRLSSGSRSQSATVPASFASRAQVRNERVAGEPVITGCDAPEILQPTEGIFDAMALLVRLTIEGKGLRAIGFVWVIAFVPRLPSQWRKSSLS